MNITGETIALALGGKKKGSGWMCKCPAHDDHTPSLSIDEKEGTILLKCFAGCDQELIVSKLKELQLWPQKEAATPKQIQQDLSPLTLESYAKAKGFAVDSLKRYGIHDGEGCVKIPYYDENKQQTSVRMRFLLEKTKPDKRFRWLGKPSLYGLWRIQKYTSKEIYLVEGESDCHALWINGYPGIGVPGAANWKEERDAKHLNQFETVWLVDEGDEGAKKLIQSLSNSILAPKIKAISLSPYKDVSEAHMSSDRLEDILEKAKLDGKPISVEKKEKKLNFLISIDEILEEEIDQMWLFDGYLLHQPQLTELFGDPSSGKTLIALDMALCLAMYQPWAGIMPEIPGLSVYIYGESRGMLKPRTQAWAKLRNIPPSEMKGNPFFATNGPLRIGSEDDDIEGLISDIDDVSELHGSPKLIIIDTLDKNMVGNENETNDMKNFIHRVSKNLIYKYQCNTMILHHPGHDNKERSRGASNLKGALDAQFSVTRKKNTDFVTLKTGIKEPKDYETPKPKAFEIKKYKFLTRNRSKEYSGAAMENIEYDESLLVKPIKGSKIAMDALEIIERRGSMIIEVWRAEFRELGYTNRKQFTRAMEWLTQNGKIKVEGNIVSVA